MQDLKWRTNSEYKSLSQAVSGRSIGAVTGSVLGGVLVDKLGQYYCDLIIAVCLTAAATVTVGIPFTTQVHQTGILIGIHGLSELIINVAGNTTILYLWREKASAPMHLLHLGFGIGCLLVPLIANPFLPATADENNCWNLTDPENVGHPTEGPSIHPTGTGLGNCSTQSFIAESSVEYAYGIVAIPTFCLAFVFLGFQCFCSQVHDERGTKIKKRDSKAMINPGSCTGGDWFYGLQLFALIFVYFLATVGLERFYTKFIRLYAIDELSFSKDEGSYINTAFWATFSMGRFYGFAIGRRLSIRVMMVSEICGVCLSVIGLNLITHADFHQEVTFWIFSLLIGLFLGPMWPTGIYWADYHMELSGMGITVVCLAGGCGGFTCVGLMGYLYDTYGHVSFVYQALACGLTVLITGICLNIIGVRHGSRFDNENGVNGANKKGDKEIINAREKDDDNRI